MVKRLTKLSPGFKKYLNQEGIKQLENIIKEKTGYLLPYVIIVMTIFILINTVTYYKIIIKNNTELTDTDTYMRLVRVEQLAETGNWYNSVIERSNYPDGDELHWLTDLFSGFIYNSI